MLHRKTNHLGAVAMCRKYVDGTCFYTANACWWNHGEIVQETIQCFMCGKSFESKTEMMSHRKKYHSDKLQQCNQFLRGSCPFQDKHCWYNHNVETEEHLHPQEKEDDIIEEENRTSSVFQEVLKNTKPPSQRM